MKKLLQRFFKWLIVDKKAERKELKAKEREKLFDELTDMWMNGDIYWEDLRRCICRDIPAKMVLKREN